MQQSFIATVRSGVAYSKVWPLVAELNPVFPENQVIRLTRFGQQYLPALSVVSIAVQLHWLGQAYLAQALASAFFLLSLPVQGWYWLGFRSLSPLPAGLLHWYAEIADKLAASGVKIPKVQGHPCYANLAALLKLAANASDKSFLRQLL